MAKVTKPKKATPANAAAKPKAAKKPAGVKKRTRKVLRRRSVELNLKEQRTLEALPQPNAEGELEYRTLEEIAKEAFGNQRRGSSPESQGNSWVRNSMRKLLKLKLVEHKVSGVKGGTKSGLYARTKLDHAQLLRELEEDGLLKPVELSVTPAASEEKAA